MAKKGSQKIREKITDGNLDGALQDLLIEYQKKKKPIPHIHSVELLIKELNEIKFMEARGELLKEESQVYQNRLASRTLKVMDEVVFEGKAHIAKTTKSIANSTLLIMFFTLVGLGVIYYFQLEKKDRDLNQMKASSHVGGKVANDRVLDKKVNDISQNRDFNKQSSKLDDNNQPLRNHRLEEKIQKSENESDPPSLNEEKVQGTIPPWGVIQGSQELSSSFANYTVTVADIDKEDFPVIHLTVQNPSNKTLSLEKFEIILSNIIPLNTPYITFLTDNSFSKSTLVVDK
ncbi:MAG: hypothetical protein AAGC85_19525, partial [Bacteroidota bacterium]